MIEDLRPWIAILKQTTKHFGPHLYIIFSNQGLRDGQAIRKLGTGETLRFMYVENEINGEATMTRPDGGQELLLFQQGSKHGQAEEQFKDGSKEIHTYVNGTLEGV